MKKILYVLALGALTACTNTPSSNNGENGTVNVQSEPDCTEDMTRFTDQFVQAYLGGDLQKALTFFSPRYVASQHDDFLEGRTEQFISEFLGAHVYKDENGVENIVSMTPNNIVSITVVAVDCNGSPNVTVKIAMKDGRFEEVLLETEMVDTENGPKPMFVGAVG